jgi:TIR domain/HEAT repeats
MTNVTDFHARRRSIILAGQMRNHTQESELISLVQRSDENPALRRSAIVALRRIGSKDARPSLIQLLMTEHSNENLRESAIKALGVLGEQEDVELLKGLSRTETIARFGRQAATKAAQRLLAHVNHAQGQERSPIVSSSRDDTERRDVFMCHASEDKDNVVGPLARAFADRGIRVWLDRAEILWGDSLTGKVNKGLSVSDYVVVVLSKHFIQKDWPKLELDSALNIEASTGRVVVLPLLVGDIHERASILNEYPILNHKLHIIWEGDPRPIVHELARRIRGSSRIGEEGIKVDWQSPTPKTEGGFRSVGETPKLGTKGHISHTKYLRDDETVWIRFRCADGHESWQQLWEFKAFHQWLRDRRDLSQDMGIWGVCPIHGHGVNGRIIEIRIRDE